jgi:hypothetical protein
MSKVIVVKATFDAEAGVWTTESADIKGLRIEATSIEQLIQKLPGAIQDLLEDCDGDGATPSDVPIELIAHASTRVRFGAAA